MPSASSPISACDLSRMRITIPSPSTRGIVTTRVSIAWPSTVSETRPSCGTRFSAMSRRGHDLHARDRAGDHALRDLRGLAQHAVHAEAHAHLAALGLEVDVRGALLDRLGDDRVDELDDRRVLGGLADLGDVGELLLALLDRLGDRVVEPAHAPDQAVDVVGRGHHRPDLARRCAASGRRARARSTGPTSRRAAGPCRRSRSAPRRAGAPSARGSR